MMAILDCNNFYCSCERLFQPKLANKPVVVLSNNDGCIVSRSDEAKKFGVAMAGPFFMAKPLIEQHDIAVFSSNYHLYGDISWRVMETLRMLLGAKNVEVYSVDEAFLDLSEVPTNQLHQTALHIKNTVEQWTGIKVSVGVAPTKVLAKLANNLAKKNKVATNCVLVLDTPNKTNQALERTPVDSVWGVGRKYAEKLHHYQINTAKDLKGLPLEWANKYLGGIVGVRLVKELNGEKAIKMDEPLTDKKMIMTTRMFGSPVDNITDIKEAVATYTSRAAEKLRRQHGAASFISVFIVPKEASHHTDFKRGEPKSGYTTLSTATSVTNELIKPALQITERLFEDGRLYKKAGVMLSHIIPDTSVQGNLFVPQAKNSERLLMNMIDNVNFSMRNDVIKFASSGTKKDWKMRQEYRSGRYTTRWEELFEVG